LDLDSVCIAGARWMKYLKRKSKARCPNCGFRFDKKEHFLSDFYIGGFALAKCDAVLTRDRGIYKKYFPDLQNYEPK
jgi:predicted nucleic acid-binding protein